MVCEVCQGAGAYKKDYPPEHPDYNRVFYCESCAAGRALIAQVQRLRQKAMYRFLPAGGSAYADWTLQSFTALCRRMGILAKKQSAIKMVQDYMDNGQATITRPDGETFPAWWLFLYGPVGSGKTGLAVPIANWKAQQGEAVLVIEVSEMLRHFRAAFHPENAVPFDTQFEAVRDVGFLVLDDLGAENATDWAREQLYLILNYRLQCNLPTVITANYTLDELAVKLSGHGDLTAGERIADRIRRKAALVKVDGGKL